MAFFQNNFATDCREKNKVLVVLDNENMSLQNVFLKWS